MFHLSSICQLRFMVKFDYPADNIVHRSYCLVIGNRRIASLGWHAIFATKNRIQEALTTTLQPRLPL